MRDGFRLGVGRLILVVGMLAATTPSFAQAPSPQPPPHTAEPASPPATNPPAAAPPATVLNKKKVQGVLGQDVRSTNGADMGRIVDVIVNRNGEPRAAVIDFGGFLGVGSRKIAVDWSALHFAPDGNPPQVTLDLNKDQVKAAPEYADKKPIVVLGPSGTTKPLPNDELPANQE